MSDFKDFLDKVLAPIRGETQNEAAPAAIVPPPEPKPVADVPKDELQRRYTAVVNAVFADSVEHRAMPILADVLAGELARIANRYGALATGDILQKFGSHLQRLTEAEDAQREADKARGEGRLPN
jgi:hypothetical protein